jgi:erythronate-4-phosphate dehydrogenase
MKIIADSNIIFAKEAFGGLGTVECVDGRLITQDKLVDADILLVRSITKVDKTLLEGTPVKFVASATIGTDHIDLAWLSQNNIGFAHAPGSNANSVAEYVLAAMLHCAKKQSRDLSNMTLGIIGVGNVGSRLMNFAKILGMKCLLNDPPKKDLSGSDMYLPLDAVLKEADIVSVHVPLVYHGNYPTDKLINSVFLSRMKKDAILINTSRGDVLDESALPAFRNMLGAIVLDVWNNEPMPLTNSISLCEIATPHIAGYSYDGKICGTTMIYEAACNFFYKEKRWQPPRVSKGYQVIHLDKKNNSDCLITCVEAAFDIKYDDANFRKILALDISKRGAFFDSLRKSYRQRLEFCNYQVEGEGIPDAEMQQLVELGFRMGLTK